MRSPVCSQIQGMLCYKVRQRKAYSAALVHQVQSISQSPARMHQAAQLRPLGSTVCYIWHSWLPVDHGKSLLSWMMTFPLCRFLEDYINKYGDLLESFGEKRITCRRVDTVEEVLREADVSSAHDSIYITAYIQKQGWNWLPIASIVRPAIAPKVAM